MYCCCICVCCWLWTSQLVFASWQCLNDDDMQIKKYLMKISSSYLHKRLIVITQIHKILVAFVSVCTRPCEFPVVRLRSHAFVCIRARTFAYIRFRLRSFTYVRHRSVAPFYVQLIERAHVFRRKYHDTSRRVFCSKTFGMYCILSLMHLLVSH